METPRKKLPVQHMPSQLLSQEANAKFFTLLEPRTQALCTAFVSVVMSKPPERPEWKPYRTGVATLIKDHTRKSYYIQIYDLVDWTKVREEELKKGSTYHVSLPTFHQLEASKGRAMGLKFSLEKEAKTFAQVARDITVTGHYKSDGPSLTVNANDKIGAGDASEDRTTTTTPTTRPPPPAKKTSTLPRPPRPKSMHREAPKSPPPPPPPLLNRNPVTPVPTNASSLSPPTPPPPRVPCSLSLPSTPVNRDAPELIAGPFPSQSLVPSSPGPTATLDRKKPTKKITKDMIGVPTNFQHVTHLGFDPDFNYYSQNIQETMSDLARRTNTTCPPLSNPPLSNPLPSNPPPPNPPPSNPPHLNPPPLNPSKLPGNRNSVCSPASDASPPKPEEAASIVSSEPSREEEQTPECEKPREGDLEALPTSAATPSATQVNDMIHCDTELVEEAVVQETAEGNKPETQTILLSEEPVHKTALDTSDEVRSAHVEETHCTSGHDSLTECNDDFEMIDNSRNLDPAQSVMQQSDVGLDVDPIPNSTTTSLDPSQSLSDNLIAKSNAVLVGADQECRKNENNAENGTNSDPALLSNESDRYNTDILDSLNELEAMLEGLSTSSSSESVPSQATAAAEAEINDRVTHSASGDAGEEKENEKFLEAQTNVSSTSVPTNDPDQVGCESFDPLEMNKLLDGAAVHSNFIFSAENLQIPMAPTRYRRKKSKQEPAPPPPPPTPTEADQNDSEYL